MNRRRVAPVVSVAALGGMSPTFRSAWRQRNGHWSQTSPKKKTDKKAHVRLCFRLSFCPDWIYWIIVLLLLLLLLLQTNKTTKNRQKHMHFCLSLRWSLTL